MIAKQVDKGANLDMNMSVCVKAQTHDNSSSYSDQAPVQCHRLTIHLSPKIDITIFLRRVSKILTLDIFGPRLELLKYNSYIQ